MSLHSLPVLTDPLSAEARQRFRENLARIMSDRGKTQAGLARELTVSRVAVHAWVRGSCFPETARLVQLAQALDVPIGALLDGDAPSQQEVMLLTAFRKLANADRLAVLAQISACEMGSSNENDCGGP